MANPKLHLPQINSGKYLLSFEEYFLNLQKKNLQDHEKWHMELAEWLVHRAPKLASRVRCSTRSSP